jgi:hypothetical protein
MQTIIGAISSLKVVFFNARALRSQFRSDLLGDKHERVRLCRCLVSFKRLGYDSDFIGLNREAVLILIYNVYAIAGSF